VTAFKTGGIKKFDFYSAQEYNPIFQSPFGQYALCPQGVCHSVD
jgi:hypothetical protein